MVSPNLRPTNTWRKSPKLINIQSSDLTFVVIQSKGYMHIKHLKTCMKKDLFFRNHVKSFEHFNVHTIEHIHDKDHNTIKHDDNKIHTIKSH